MNDSWREFDRTELLQLLRELGEILDGWGLTASIYIVGGTAMTLTLNSRRATRDIDAYFRDHKEALLRAADIVGERHGLKPGWFNSTAAMFLPTELDPHPGELSFPGLRATVASPEYLLAMKLIASRGKDYDDLERLFNFLGITTPQEAADIANRLFDEDSMHWQGPEDALFLAQDVFTRAERAGRTIGETPSEPGLLVNLEHTGGAWAKTAKARDAERSVTAEGANGMHRVERTSETDVRSAESGGTIR
jgi:predicted nucleotidyltransferase